MQMSNVDKIEGLHAPMGQFINIKRYPPADYRGVSAPNADTLYSLAWLDLGRAAGVQPSGHGQALLPVRDDRSLDDGFQFARHAHRRRPGRQLPDHRAGLDRRRAGRDEADQVRDALHGDPGPHLCRRHRPGLCGRQCAAGPVQDRAAQRLRQTLHVPGAAGQSEPRLQHDRRSADGDPRHGYLDLLQHDGAAHGWRGSAGAAKMRRCWRAWPRSASFPGQPFDMAKLDAGRAGRAQGSRQGRAGSASRPTRTTWARW